MTETTGAGTLADPTTGEKAGSIGRPLPGCEIEIVSLDDPSQVLPVGQDGEIRIRGRNVTSGYWNQPEETANAFRDGFLLTGDIGRQDEDGYLFLMGRVDDIMLVAGHNISTMEVESALVDHPGVAEAAVIGKTHDIKGQAICAFVIVKSSYIVTESLIGDLKAHVAKKIGCPAQNPLQHLFSQQSVSCYSFQRNSPFRHSVADRE
jgi:long-chain acyl-CoA synthetase